jgi:hypothetical protein
MLMSKDGDGAKLTLKPGINRIGRNATNDCSIDDVSVSGTHCEVIVGPDAVRVRDLDSTNGTFVDEFRIRETFLHEGQVLRIGSCAFCYIPDAARAPTSVRLSALPAPIAPPLPPPVASVPVPPVAPGVKTCANHPSQVAVFVCKKCAGNFCNSCINEQIIANRKLRFCRTCGEECVSLREPAPPVKRTPNFFEMLPGAFRYPFKRDGLIMLISGTLFFGFLDAIVGGPHLGGFIMGGYVVIVEIFAIGYLIAYMKAIVAVSAYGEDGMPRWPDFENYYEDIVHPILLVVGCILLCFTPTFVYMYYVDYTLPGREQLGFDALVLLGCAGLPMCVLAVFLHETIFALNPLVLFVSILRVSGEYIIACIVIALLIGLRWLSNYIAEATHIIPFIPKFVDGFVFLYLITVEMRILGLLFHTKRKQLRWAIS